MASINFKRRLVVVCTTSITLKRTPCAKLREHLGKKSVAYVPSAHPNTFGGEISSIFFNTTGNAGGGPLPSSKRTLNGSADILFVGLSASHVRVADFLLTYFAENSNAHHKLHRCFSPNSPYCAKGNSFRFRTKPRPL